MASEEDPDLFFDGVVSVPVGDVVLVCEVCQGPIDGSTGDAVNLTEPCPAGIPHMHQRIIHLECCDQDVQDYVAEVKRRAAMEEEFIEKRRETAKWN